MKRLLAPGPSAFSCLCFLTALAVAALAPGAAAQALPSVTVAATSPTAAIDGTATGMLTFTRTGSITSSLVVNYALSGSAAKWTDYYRLPEGDMPVSVTFAAGAASATLAITAKANSTGASPETAVLTLTPNPSYAVGSPSAATITIVASAPSIPSVGVVASVPMVTIGGSTTGLFTFSRTGDVSSSLAINYALSGSAAKWTDYYRLPEGDMPVSVTFAAGAASTTLAITAKANSTGASPETAVLTLTPNPSYTVGSASAATITIAPAAPSIPSVGVVASVPTVTIGGSTTALFTFSRTGNVTSSLAINYALAGSAVKWTDYYRLPEGDMPVSVTFAAGAASTTLAITAKANSTGASPETTVLTLTPDPSYAIGGANTATITIVAATPAAPASAPAIAATTTTPAATPAAVSVPTAAAVPSTQVANPSVVPTPSTGIATAGTAPAESEMDDTNLIVPLVGDHALRVLTPTLLELRQITTKAPDPAQVSSWNFVGANGVSAAPLPAQFTVTIAGHAVTVTAVGFRRRVLYAPLKTYDLRIDNALYLQIATPVADGQEVAVTDPDGQIWAASEAFAVTADPLRYSPGIHVNQEGYVPTFPKKAMIGYYLGDMGEMPVIATTFSVVDVNSNAVVFQGSLTQRQDVGYETTPLPYQQVLEADFSGLTTTGEYRIQVPGMGASLPFVVNDGIAMGFARTYALGIFGQRSGAAAKLPYTRFTHAADHTAPAQVPASDSDPQFSFTWKTEAGYAATLNSNNPAQIAPALTSNATSLYPFVNTGTVDVSGGHWDAGDYSKYTENSAELVHYLIFSVDSIPGVAAMDNLGIPESGDGVPDVLQEAKWEADFLAKMQDADGGFYFLVYPKDREYESNVLPENGDAQVVWPKSTSVTAAAVAALAEAGSSPAMLKFYPQAAALYEQKALLGWQFLQKAITKYGKAGAYQKITFYSDDWTHDDELAWAAAAMFAATGNTQYQTQLFAWFPNPADSSTFRWGWWRMSEGWGNAIRTYAFAARSGRLPQGALNAAYLASCEAQVVAAGDDAVTWSGDNAYASPFPPATKAVQGGGWYFSLDQASDMAVAYQINPKPAYIDALVGAMNYEGGTNPVNVTFLTGLGLKRQQENVSQYAQNSRRILPPSGIPLGQVTAGFEYLSSYGSELSELSYPTDSGSKNIYPYYDRWSDAFNVTQEFITVNQARSFMATAFLATLTSSSAGAWTAPAATISVPSTVALMNTPLTLSVTVPGMDLAGARIVWEGRDQQPAFGSTYTVSPVNDGDQWVEAEIEWPDGRRAFAENDFQANSPVQIWIDDALPAGASITADGGEKWTWVSQNPTPESGTLAAQTITSAGLHELSFTGATGAMQVNTGDTLFAWVYLDSASPPSEIMLAWNDGSSWEHRAYWGANDITYGTSGTAGRYNAGPLPATGQWVKLSVPASAVGLEGVTVSGMDFALYDGGVTWDAIGRGSASP